MNIPFIMASDSESLQQTLECIPVDSLPIVISDEDADHKRFKRKATFFTDNLVHAFNHARDIAIASKKGMIVIRSGAVFDKAAWECLNAENDRFGIISGTILDPTNSSIEYTSKVEGGFPVPKFTKGPRQSGISESWWLDGPVLKFSHRALLNVGEFDKTMQEHFFMVDYCLRARWHEMELAINHDVPVTYLNKKPYSSVFKGREPEIFALGQHNFKRKWGGNMILTLGG